MSEDRPDEESPLPSESEFTPQSGIPAVGPRPDALHSGSSAPSIHDVPAVPNVPGDPKPDTKPHEQESDNERRFRRPTEPKKAHPIASNLWLSDPQEIVRPPVPVEPIDDPSEQPTMPQLAIPSSRPTLISDHPPSERATLISDRPQPPTAPGQTIQQPQQPQQRQPTQASPQQPAPIKSAPPNVASGCLNGILSVFGINSKNPRRRGCGIACLGCLLSMVGFFGIFSCILLIGGIAIYKDSEAQLTVKIDQAQKDQETQTFQTAYVYDRNGVQLHEIIGEGLRTKITLAEMPQSIKDATIAVEDKTFYDNPGVDVSAILRSLFVDVQAGYAQTGASTITQQLVRAIAFDYQDRITASTSRKIQEAIMALILTREKSKDDILEMYLNQIYYGNLAYGIEAAAKTYFGKSAKDLDVAESSLLAGLPQAPASFDPLNPDPGVQDAVIQRHRTVLTLMVSAGKITQDQADKAISEPLHFADPNVNLKSPHFTIFAEDQLKTLLPSINIPLSYINTGGLSIYTTLDSNIQALAENAVTTQIAQIRDKNNAHNAAVVVLQPGTGEILAMVGSVDYNDDSIKGRVNITTSLKQPGSAIKPVTYSGAFEHGFSPGSILWDVPMKVTSPGAAPYTPVNYDGRFRGPVRVRDALAQSLNIPAVQTLQLIGVPAFLEIAQRFGIQSFGTDASKYGVAITLGGADLTPLELAQAYSVFATNGSLVPVTAINCIINSDKKIVYQYENGCNGKGTADATTITASANPKPVIDPRTAFMISDMLADNVARTPEMGANSPLRTDGITTSVKTGTTNDFRDNWTMGYTHNVVVGVWVGNTDNTPMNNSTGLTGAAPIWHQIITSIYGDPHMMASLQRNGKLNSDDLNPPEGVVKKPLCVVSSIKDPATDCTRGRAEWEFASPPLVPDQNGKLVPSQSTSPTQSPANGPLISDVEPGIAQALVYQLDPGYAASLVGVSTDPSRPAPPPPSYCLVPQEVRAQIPNAVVQLFIKPPSNPETEIYARIYAAGAGVPILPNLPCTQDMLGKGAPSGVSAHITSPHPGDTVTKLVQVSGTVTWVQGQATYFTMQIEGPQFPNWTTFGSGDTQGIHKTPVINGPLDTFGAEGLQPGIYKLRVVIVGNDGNYLYVSGETPVNVTGQ